MQLLSQKHGLLHLLVRFPKTACAWRGKLALAFALAFACPLFISPHFAQAAVGSKSEDFFKEAQSSIRSGNTSTAIIQLKNAIKSDLNNVAARYQLALLYLETGDAASAEKELKAARQRGLAPEQVILPLNQAYLMQDKGDALIKESIPETVSGEILANILILRAQAYLLINDPEQAEKEIVSSFLVTKSLPDAYLILSTLYERRGDIPAAESYADQALGLAPKAPSTLYRKAEVRRMQGDPEGARQFYGQVLESNPLHQRARLGRALVSIGLGDTAQAEEDVEAVFEFDPNNFIAKYIRSLLLTQQQKPEQALELLHTARGVEVYPPALYLFGSLYFNTGKPETAREYFERYLAIQPNDVAGKLSLAAIDLQSNKPEAAIKILEPLQNQYEDNFQIITLLANAYVAEGRFEDAAPLYDKATHLDPGNDQLKLLLARSQFSSGASEQALDVLQSLIQQKPDSITARTMLITGYMNNGDLDQARSTTEALRNQLPASGLPHYFYAAISLLEDDREQAKQDLEQALTIQEDFYPARISLARIALDENLPNEARNHYNAIIKNDASHLQALTGLAQIAWTAGDSEAALNLLNTAIKKNPGKTAPQVMQINILLQQEKVERALVAARKLVNTAPNSGDALDTLARAQQANGESLSAVATYRNLVDLKATSPLAYLRLGRALTLINNEAEASKAFDAAIKLDPDYMVARVERINSEQRLNGTENAKALAVAMRKDIKDPIDADLLIANTLYEGKNYEQALTLYQKAWADRRERGILVQLYRTLDGLDRRDEGITLIQSWLSDKPDDAVIRFLLSSARIKDHDYTAAISEAERSLQKAPQNPAVLNNLAWLYHRQGDIDKAIQYAEQAYQIQPNSPEITDTLGWLLMSKNKTTRGLNLLREANQKRPEDPEISYHFAVALNSAGQSAEAKDILQTIISQNKTFDGLQEATELYDSLNR